MIPNNIPQGYKQTELGIIPEDWEVTTIKQIADITTGNKNTQDAEDGGKYPFYVRSQNVERINSYSYDCEGVVTAGDGVGTGKIFHYVRGKFGLHQRAYLIYNFKDFDSQYFYWYFSQYFYDRINQMTAKSSVDSVRKEMIEDMCILRAPIAEQRAIAEALSDVDGLIAALDKKIAKKRLLKQGAMQQLLTGKKRLPGFTDEWVECELKDYFEITAGGDVDIDKFSSVKTSYCKYPIYSNSLDKEGLYGYTSRPNYSAGSVTITGRGTLGHAEYRDYAFDAIVRLIVMTPKGNRVCGLFIKELLNLTEPFIFESTGVPQLTAPQVGSTKIKVPQKIEEQQAIATILSDMDKEIADLEAQRDKYRLLKSGMMQKLLTGQIRLKIE